MWSGRRRVNEFQAKPFPALSEGKEREVFFFEKKKQKTFINWFRASLPGGVHRPKVIKVFCFFFSKKKTFFSCAAHQFPGISPGV